MRALLRAWAPDLGVAAVATALSSAAALLGSYLALEFFPAAPGHLEEYTGFLGLFRADATWYWEIATKGYSFTGDVCRIQTTTFFPAFPLWVAALSRPLGLDPIWVGTIGNKVLLLAGLGVLHRALRERLGSRVAAFSAVGAGLATGAWAYHGFYSEATGLLLFALCLLFSHRRSHGWLAASSCLLGATRPAMLAFSCAFALQILAAAWRETRASGPRVRAIELARGGGLAALCFGGAVSYLAYLRVAFGPLAEVFWEVKRCALGVLHQPLSVFDALTFAPLIRFAGEAFGAATRWYDVRLLNLAWLWIGLISVVYGLRALRWNALRYGSAAYFYVVYLSIGGTQWLSSAQRYLAILVPVFAAAAALHGWVEARAGRHVAACLTGALAGVSAASLFAYSAAVAAGFWGYF